MKKVRLEEHTFAGLSDAFRVPPVPLRVWSLDSIKLGVNFPDLGQQGHNGAPKATREHPCCPCHVNMSTLLISRSFG